MSDAEQRRLNLCALLAIALGKQEEAAKAKADADEAVTSARAELEANLRGFGGKK